MIYTFSVGSLGEPELAIKVLTANPGQKVAVEGKVSDHQEIPLTRYQRVIVAY